VFGNYGRLLFPVNSGYYGGSTLGNLSLTWYNGIDPDMTVKICNTLRDRAAAGESALRSAASAARGPARPAPAAAPRAFFRALRASHFRRLLFVSRESRAAFCARNPELRGKTAVLGNLVGAAGLRRLAAQPCPFQRQQGETVFLYLGRLEEEQKRLSRLLEAFALARRERPGLRLLLVGEGPARALCEGTIRTLDLGSTVTLFGALTNPYPVLAAADCLVLASDYEGFPVVCYEALALGKDVISTVPVSDELVDLRDHGAICEKSAASLAAAMLAYAPHRRSPLDAQALDRRRLEAWEALF